MNATSAQSVRRLVAATLFLCLPGAGPAAAGVFGWTLSASNTDPFANVASPALGNRQVHLWLVCDNTGNGIATAAFGVSSSLGILSFTPAAGFTNSGTPTNVSLVATGCPIGPVRAGHFTILDLGLGFEMCIVPSPSGANESVDCTGATFENSVVGFVAGSSSPCGSVAELCTAADLGVTNATSEIAPLELAPFTLTVDVANDGADDATLISIDAPLPAGLTYESHLATAGSWSPGTGIWFLSSLDVSDTASLEITAHADGGTTGTEATFVATIASSAPGDPIPSNDADSTSVYVGQSQFTQLAVTKTADLATIAEGDTVTFHVSVANVGTVDADSLRIVDLLPAGLTYAEHVTGSGTFVPGSGTWNVQVLAASDSASLDLRAFAAPGTGGTDLTNRAFLLGADPPDTTGADNADSATVTVTPPPVTDVELRLASSADTIRELEPLTVEILVRNLGPFDATSVTVQRTWPIGVTLVSSEATRGAVDDSSGAWNVGALAVADSALLTMQAHPELGAAGTDVSFAGSIAGVSPADSNAANDGASASVAVTAFLQATLPDLTARPGEAVPITALLQAPIVIDSTSLFVRAPNAPQFAASFMTETVPGEWDATIPGSAVTALGLHYYCVVHAGEYAIRMPASGFQNVRVLLDDHLVLTLEAGRFAHVGSPVRPTAGATVPSLFDELGVYDREGWRYGAWDGERYREGPEEAPVPTPGQGFWIWAARTTEIRWDGTAPDLSADLVVPLQPGWNQVSSPLPVPVAFASVTRPADVHDDLIAYDGSGYVHFSSAFLPGAAYWIHNAANATRHLTFPVAPPAARAPEPRSEPAEANWSVQIDVDAGATRDHGNRFGMGGDAVDVLEAPDPPGPFVALAFADEARRLHEDYRPPNPNGETWSMRLSWGVAETPYRLRFGGLDTLPPEWGVTLIPPTGARPIEIDASAPRFESVTPAAPSSLEWTVAVGTSAFRAGAVALADAGLSATLERPRILLAPNPVRRGAHAAGIALLVPEQERFSLSLYDVHGRLVTTLHDGMLAPGVHRFVWDRCDASGRSAAAGVYFVRARGATTTDHRKLVLVR